MKKRDAMNHETFKKPGAERRYMNRLREMEKKQRKQPVGRQEWEESV